MMAFSVWHRVGEMYVAEDAVYYAEVYEESGDWHWTVMLKDAPDCIEAVVGCGSDKTEKGAKAEVVMCVIDAVNGEGWLNE